MVSKRQANFDGCILSADRTWNQTTHCGLILDEIVILTICNFISLLLINQMKMTLFILSHLLFCIGNLKKKYRYFKNYFYWVHTKSRNHSTEITQKKNWKFQSQPRISLSPSIYLSLYLLFHFYNLTGELNLFMFAPVKTCAGVVLWQIET